MSLDEFAAITSRPCHYCGTPPANRRKGGGNYRRKDGKTNEWFTYVYNGVDRIDSTKGYSVANCVTACTVCNHAKTDMTYTAFNAYLDRLAAFRIQGG